VNKPAVNKPMVNKLWAARIAFPAAFLLGVTVAVLLVRAGLAEDDAASPTATLSISVETGTTTTRTQPGQRRAFATVRAGDTLAVIAARHDTTVDRLLELNPALDPNNMQIGQRVRVR
jgi:LysM repeat protein